jgi:ABC-type oligopeptide transport system substrate-binding subunit
MRFFAPVAIAAIVLAGSISAAHAAVPKHSLRVAVGATSSGLKLDPKDARFTSTANIQGAFLAPLYRIDGDGRMVPILAARAPRITAGGTKLTVTLRANARWSDGVPITSYDVLMNLGRAAQGNAAQYLVGYLKQFARFSAVTPRSFTLVFKRPSSEAAAVLATQLFTPVPAHVVKRYKSAWTQPRHMVSSGPFVLTAASRTKLIGAPNRRYVGRKARLRRIEFDLGRVKASGNWAALPGELTEAQMSTLTAQHVPVTRELMDSTHFAYFNTTNPLLQNPQIRRAIAESLDRSSIATLSNGTAQSTVVSLGSPRSSEIGDGERLLDDSEDANTTDAAAQLAAGGGWPEGVRLNVYYAQEGDYADAVTAQFAADLGTIGIPVALHPVSIKDSVAGIFVSPTRADVDVVLVGWGADIPDASNYYQLFTCAGVNAGRNQSNYCNSTYDALYAQLARAFTLPDRLAAFRALEDFLTGPQGAFPAVPLYTPSVAYAATGSVLGMNTNAFGITAWERVRTTR